MFSRLFVFVLTLGVGVSNVYAQVRDLNLEDNITLDHVLFVASPKWHLLRQRAVEDGTLFFRKFSFPVIDDIQQTGAKNIKNIISYGCQRNPRVSDFVVIHLPTWVRLKTIDTDSWVSRLDLHIAIDRLSFTAVGEYRKREFFIDLNDEFRESLLKLLISEQILIEFGPKDERINIRQMYRTPNGGNVVGYLDEIVPKISTALGGGKAESLETETILGRCSAFKKNGKY